MRKLWSKTEMVDGNPRKKICTISDIKVTLDGKPVSTKNSFLFPSITVSLSSAHLYFQICSMGSRQSKFEAAYDYTRMNYLMGTDGNISNSISYSDYMVKKQYSLLLTTYSCRFDYLFPDPFVRLLVRFNH